MAIILQDNAHMYRSDNCLCIIIYCLDISVMLLCDDLIIIIIIIMIES